MSQYDKCHRLAPEHPADRIYKDNKNRKKNTGEEQKQKLKNENNTKEKKTEKNIDSKCTISNNHTNLIEKTKKKLRKNTK